MYFHELLLISRISQFEALSKTLLVYASRSSSNDALEAEVVNTLGEQVARLFWRAWSTGNADDADMAVRLLQ